MELSTTFPQHGICLSYKQIVELFRRGTFDEAAQSDYFRDIFKLLYYKGLAEVGDRPPYGMVQFFLF